MKTRNCERPPHKHKIHFTFDGGSSFSISFLGTISGILEERNTLGIVGFHKHVHMMYFAVAQVMEG